MKKLLSFLASITLTCSIAQSVLPRPDHIIIVMLENRGYSNIIGNSNAPYLNTLANDTCCAIFSNSYGVTHPSQPNYIGLYSGGTQGVTDDNAPSGTPFSTCNLGYSLLSNGYTFMGYSEDLPSVGSLVNTSGNYVQRHCPWSFWQGNGTNQIPSSVHQPYTTFSAITDYNTLPTVSFIIPNLAHDMHNPVLFPSTAISNGDTWLNSNLPPLVQWIKTHNSLLIIQYDEDEGLVVGGVTVGGNNNKIPTLMLGPMVQRGTYSTKINHYNILRTIEDMYALPLCDSSNYYQPIANCWKPTIGIKELRNDYSINTYPNPVSDNVVIKLDSKFSESIELSLYDVSGKCVLKKTQYIKSGINEFSVKLKDFENGLYLITVDGEHICFSQKVVIEH